MIIAVAGPYSAPTEEARQKNLDVLNEAAARLVERGHIPLIGINAAVPVVDKAHGLADRYNAIMDISMAVVNACEALLFIGESRGANMERDLFVAKSLPVYYSLDEVPDLP
jgi:hypothetical protein